MCAWQSWLNDLESLGWEKEGEKRGRGTYVFSGDFLGDKNIAYAVLLKHAYSKGFLNPCWQEQGWQGRWWDLGGFCSELCFLPSMVSWGEDITLRTHSSSLTMTDGENLDGIYRTHWGSVNEWDLTRSLYFIKM